MKPRTSYTIAEYNELHDKWLESGYECSKLQSLLDTAYDCLKPIPNECGIPDDKVFQVYRKKFVKDYEKRRKEILKEE